MYKSALKALVDRLEAVHADSEYVLVWQSAQLHYGPYDGPTYIAELTRAKAVLRYRGRGRALKYQ